MRFKSTFLIFISTEKYISANLSYTSISREGGGEILTDDAFEIVEDVVIGESRRGEIGVRGMIYILILLNI
jgi:hypothetical protein